LRTFGEAGTVKTKTYIIPKLHDKGVQYNFVGYTENHKGVYIGCGIRRHAMCILHKMWFFPKRMLFQTAVDKIAVIPSLTQDETIDAGESNILVETVVDTIPSQGGGSNYEHSNLSSDDESDGEDATPDGATKPTGGEWQTMMRSGRTIRLPSCYHAKIGAATIMTTSTRGEKNYY
jgi:hypothetical protein